MTTEPRATDDKGRAYTHLSRRDFLKRAAAVSLAGATAVARSATVNVEAAHRYVIVPGFGSVLIHCGSPLTSPENKGGTAWAKFSC